MYITQSGLITSSRLDYNSNALYTRASSPSSSFIPTRDEVKSNHETDKQNEDNTTWFLEYKALLNSKLTTLITTLTNAYTTDLDASMGNPRAGMPWNNITNMQGKTGEPDGSGGKILDPGAMRTSFAYLKSFNSNVATSPNNNGWWDWNSPTSSYDISYTSGMPSTTPVANAISGTTTFTTSGVFELDRLEVNISPTNTLLPTYLVTKDNKPGINATDIYYNKNIGNNFLLSLYKFFEKPENMDLLRFGMFKDVYVIGTSSLPTGSQVQGSLSLNWMTPGNANGYISINQERFAAFYHS